MIFSRGGGENRFWHDIRMGQAGGRFNSGDTSGDILSPISVRLGGAPWGNAPECSHVQSMVKSGLESAEVDGVGHRKSNFESTFSPQPSDNGCRCEVSTTIRVELNPEMERQLAAEALARGIALELYAQRLLQEAIASRSKAHGRASQEEFRAFLDALASKAPNVPQLRSETFSREMIYGEHA